MDISKKIILAKDVTKAILSQFSKFIHNMFFSLGNPRIHTTALAQKEKPNMCQGEPSLQNALEIARKSLRYI